MDSGKRPPLFRSNKFEKESTLNPKILQLGFGSQSKPEQGKNLGHVRKRASERRAKNHRVGERKEC